MKKMKKMMALLLALVLAVSLMVPTAFAAEEETGAQQDVETTAEAAASFTSDDPDDYDMISLADVKTFTAKLPLTEALSDEDLANVVWSLDCNKELTGSLYMDLEKYPNHKDGGELSTWQTNGKAAMFTDMATSQITENGTTYLVLTFKNACYWGNDPSAPHSSGGSYLDVCGYFDLSAKLGDTTLGTVATKVVPYDDFNTMAEIYTELDEMVSFAEENTDLYVEKFSMGKSSGDIYEAMDMPYLIVAGDKADVSEWLAFTEKAESDPTAVLADIAAGKYDDIKVPVMFSNVHANEVAATDGIMSFTWLLLKAAAADGKMTYSDLASFTEAGQAQLKDEMEKYGVVVPDLVKDTATYLGFITDENVSVMEWFGQTYVSTYSGVVDLEKYYNVEDITVDIDALLDDVFFILVPEENVEGREYITRTASSGYDLNRDNSFQTTAETQNMQKLIGTYNPVSLMEFHGRVEGFQIEPCSPPHEPNFEYDLLSEHMMYAGEAFGTAAVASNDGYNSYTTPMRDYLYDNGDGTASWSPWDDMSTSYTPQFAMLQGSLAYTVELPAYNDDTVAAVCYGCLGLSDYLAENKLSVLTSQTEIFERGVTNANSDAYEMVGQWLGDQNDVEGAESDLWRPEYDAEGENGNFYPEFYIIPLDAANQSNLDAAYDMMEWLSRNDVKINVTKSDYTYDGVTYPAGTMIVSMYQAKRSVANGALYDGTFITEWSDLYSEGITTFNETRGFDMVTVAKTGEIDKINAICSSDMDYEDCLNYIEKNKKSQFSGIKNADVIISNVSEASTSAVNALLKAGKTVAMITDEDSEYYGDFICSYSDYLSVADKYTLTATGIACNAENHPDAQIITKSPTVFINGASGKNSSGFVYTTQVSNSANWNYDRIAMELMNFDTTSDATKADAIIGASSLGSAALAEVLAGTPYIGYGSTVARGLSSLVKVTYTSLGGMDCMPYVTYGEKNLINGSYIMDEDDIMYGYGNGFFSAIPEGAEALVYVDGSKEPTEGFLPITERNAASVEEFFNGSTLAFTYEGKAKDGESDINVAIFANSLTHKVHQRDEYAYISNFLFASQLGEDYEVNHDTQVVFDDNGHWTECAVCEQYATESVAHEMEEAFDDDGHWTECTGCDYATESAAHDIDTLYNISGHWDECSECDYATEPVAHDIDTLYDANGHWDECSGCDYAGESVAHILQTAHDADGHWDECTECDYATESAAHEFVDKQCACGQKDAPKTGDMTPVALLSGLMILSALAAAAMVLQTKKQKA